MGEVVNLNRKERRKLKPAELRAQVCEARGVEPGIDLEMEDGQIFHIPNPAMVDDETQIRLDKFYAGEGLDREWLINPATGEPWKGKDDKPLERVKEPATIKGKLAEPHPIRLAKALLGEDVHKKFIEAGGHSTDVAMAWEAMARERKDEEAEDPKD